MRNADINANINAHADIFSSSSPEKFLRKNISGKFYTIYPVQLFTTEKCACYVAVKYASLIHNLVSLFLVYGWGCRLARAWHTTGGS